MRHGFLIGLVVIAGPLRAGDDLDSLQRVAAEDIRMIAEAVHRFAVANNYYPGRSPGSEFVPVESLRQDLVPEYLTVIPAADPWARTYWYWTNGEHFIVGSGGPEAAEGTWHDVIEQSPRGPSHALESLCSSPGEGSVLLIDGRFCALSKDITHGPPTGTLTDEERSALSIEDLRAIAVAVMGVRSRQQRLPGTYRWRHRCRSSSLAAGAQLHPGLSAFRRLGAPVLLLVERQDLSCLQHRR